VINPPPAAGSRDITDESVHGITTMYFYNHGIHRVDPILVGSKNLDL
jgi:hypothetical protein